MASIEKKFLVGDLIGDSEKNDFNKLIDDVMNSDDMEGSKDSLGIPDVKDGASRKAGGITDVETSADEQLLVPEI